MQLLTADGTYASSQRSGWPEAGTLVKTDYSAGWSTIPLAPLASGEARWAGLGDIYRTNPWVYGAVKLKARLVARLPLHVFQLLADADRVRVRWDLPGVTGRPSAAALLDKVLNIPAPGISKRRLMTQTLVDYHIYGNGLWSVDKDGGSISNLWHVPWRRVTVHAGDKVPIESFEIRGGAGSRFLSPDDVVHFSTSDDPDRPIGMSPLMPLRYTMRLLDAMQRSLASFFQNSARLSGTLKVDGRTSKENLAEIREALRQMYTSPENAGSVFVSSGEFTAMGVPPQQQDIIQLIKLSRDEVLTTYHIPPPVAGILDGAIKSNVVELREQLYRDVIGPDAEMVEQEIYAQLLPMMPALSTGEYFAEHEMGQMLRPTLLSIAEVFPKMTAVFARDEIRKMFNLRAIGTPDAEVPEAPLNMRPIGLPSSAYGGATLPGTEEGEGEQPADEPGPGGDDDVDEDEI